MKYSTFITRVSWIILILLWVYTIVSVMSMPDTVPIHFNAKNDADGYGSRYTYLIFPGIATFIIALFEIIKRYPQHLNYPVAITEENRERQQDLAFSLLSTIGLVLPVLFIYILYSTQEYIHHGSMNFSILWLLALVFIPIITYFFLAHRAR